MESHRQAMEADLYSEQALLRNRAYYYANITFIDEQIGRIMQMLEEEGLADNTLVIFTSDHGELLGDHRLWFKNLGYEGSLHVPMIAWWPGVIKSGTRCNELTTLLDIFPTFVNRANEPRKYDGRSGVDLLEMLANPSSVRLDVVCSEFYVAPNYMLHVRSKEWKYLFYQNGGYEELYHLLRIRFPHPRILRISAWKEERIFRSRKVECGRIGLRQMALLIAEYRNLKVNQVREIC